MRTHEGKLVFSEKEKNGFVTAIDLIKCLRQIIKEIAPYMRTYF